MMKIWLSYIQTIFDTQNWSKYFWSIDGRKKETDFDPIGFWF